MNAGFFGIQHIENRDPVRLFFFMVLSLCINAGILYTLVHFKQRHITPVKKRRLKMVKIVQLSPPLTAQKPKPAPMVRKKPKPAAKPKTASRPKPKPKPIPAPLPALTFEPKPEPVAEMRPKPPPEAAAKPAAEVEPSPVAEPVLDTSPTPVPAALPVKRDTDPVSEQSGLIKQEKRSEASEAVSTGQKAEDKTREIEAYRLLLARLIDKHKHYPRVARRFKREGDARLRFSITPEGVLHDIVILKSSNFRLLDRAAMEAVQKVNRFPAPPVLSDDDTPYFDHEITIRFRLR